MKDKRATVTFSPRRGGAAKVLINLLVTALVGLAYFYFELPAINLHDESFYFFFLVLAVTYCVTAIITSGIWKLRGEGTFVQSVKDNFKVPLGLCLLFAAVLLVGSLLSSVALRAKAYSRLLTIEQGDFAQEVEQISFNNIPLLDKDSAQKLANRKLGELSDMVSQFEVSDLNTQINYQGRPVRVTPLEYADTIKWLTNRSQGLPAYFVIDMVTQNVEMVRLEQGMRYSTDEHFMRNLSRHLRFAYPTYMFDTPTFEIDEDGSPYWVCPRVVNTIGLFGGRDICGAVLVNAVTGESQYYDEADVPTWVDRVFTAELIIEQYDYYGQYHNGFLNSLFGQKDVTVTTDGYNYMAMGDDVYMYTGVTSVGTDESNVGFILTNQRTKETKFYKVAGAEEYSAMSSAEGVVQHLNYAATFPLLLNIESQPTYFMALKDNAGLVKMYAMVNVQQYQIVATGSTPLECETEYEKLLSQNHLVNSAQVETAGVEGVVTDKREAVQDGDTWYYLQLDGKDVYYALNAAECPAAILVNVGDSVRVEARQDAEGAIVTATGMERLQKAQAPASEPTEAKEAAAASEQTDSVSEAKASADAESTSDAASSGSESEAELLS